MSGAGHMMELNRRMREMRKEKVGAAISSKGRNGVFLVKLSC
ncbi:MAG: hypothetical protein ACI8XB_001590 [Patiriisocius sp.]|jgi:hypothetical protein